MLLLLSHLAQTGHGAVLSWDTCLHTEKTQCSKEYTLEKRSVTLYAGLYLGVELFYASCIGCVGL